jgi:mono/diheme cytochrome c family protein
MVGPTDGTRPRNRTILVVASAACLCAGWLGNLGLLKLTGGVWPTTAEPTTLLPLLLPLLDTAILTVFLWVSLRLGWHASRSFWLVLVVLIGASWLAGDLMPALIGDMTPAWRIGVACAGPVLVALMIAGLLALRPDAGSSRTRDESLGSRAGSWLSTLCPRPSTLFPGLSRPCVELVRGGGVAVMIVALALPLRIGLLAYGLPDIDTLVGTEAHRLQHVPAPSEYESLQNPFLGAPHGVLLEKVGDDPEAVRAIVRDAVANRTDARAAELVDRVPIMICEATDEESSHRIAEALQSAGAVARATDTLNAFKELIQSNRPSAIGKPSQVLDNTYLETGHDAIAELRDALESSESTERSNDRDLLARAYRAYITAEGRSLYQINCRPCHGTKGNGDGPTAAGFRLRPANFRDPLGIAALTPGALLWRIEQGAAALPSEATPWDSSMPAWQHELDRELIWKIILGEFSTANATPAVTPHHAAHTQPSTRSVGREPPQQSWLEWPVTDPPTRDTMQSEEFVKRGAYIYYYRCMPCHGVTGRGDGPAADTMWPRPRDFTAETLVIASPQPKFKFRTTKQGWLPIDSDLYRTISRGLSGTAMEGWNNVLSPEEIWQVIAYVQTLSPAWKDPEHIAANPYDPTVVQELAGPNGSPPVLDYEAMQVPAQNAKLIAEGRDTFLRFRCLECHGIDARGDGPALGQHYDDWGYRMWPQNLANPHNYKAGYAIKDIYRAFANRLDGTVMPVYSANILDAKDLAHGEHLQWGLAAYVQHQVQAQAGRRRGTNRVRAARVNGALPTDPLDAQWDRIEPCLLPLSGQVVVAPRWTAPSANQVAIRAAFNDDAISIWLRWDDRRPNVTHEPVSVDFRVPGDRGFGPATYAAPALEKQSPVVFGARDQVEIQFPASSHATASAGQRSPRAQRPPFFYGSNESPVLLWRWFADRQGLAISKRTEEIAGGKADRIECISTTDEVSGAAVDLFRGRGPTAELEPLPRSPSTVSRASWSNGAWTLVMSGAPIATRDWLSDGEGLPVAIHIWDGLAGESDLRMAVSSWIDVVPEGTDRWRHWAAALLGVVAVAAEILVFWRFRST